MKKLIFILSIALISCKNIRFMADSDIAAASTTAKGFKGFDNLNNAVGQICGMWNGIVGAFKTTYQTKIKQYFPGDGFRKLSLSANFMAAGGFRMTAWDTVWQRKLPLFGMSDDQVKKCKVSLEFAEFSDSTTWVSTNLGFNTEDGARDNVKSITLLTNVRDDNKFDYVIMDFSLAFKFAPDVQWVTKAGSYAGGIFANQKDELIETPRGIKDEDITAILEMFKILSLKFIAALAGVTLDINIS